MEEETELWLLPTWIYVQGDALLFKITHPHCHFDIHLVKIMPLYISNIAENYLLAKNHERIRSTLESDKKYLWLMLHACMFMETPLVDWRY
jgi:hypothetical protein